MTSHHFLTIMMTVNAVLLAFSLFYTHDNFAAIISFFGCLTSWLAIYLLSWSESLQMEIKNKLGEEYVDEQ